MKEEQKIFWNKEDKCMVEMRTKATAWRALALGDEGKIQSLSSMHSLFMLKLERQRQHEL
jgi:hypothetical protein